MRGSRPREVDDKTARATLEAGDAAPSAGNLQAVMERAPEVG